MATEEARRAAELLLEAQEEATSLRGALQSTESADVEPCHTQDAVDVEEELEAREAVLHRDRRALEAEKVSLQTLVCLQSIC